MKILIPFDFSTESINALKFGEQMTMALDAKLEVLHCLNLPNYTYHEKETMKRFRSELIEKARLALKNHLKISLLDDRKVDVEINEGSASAEILKKSTHRDVQYTLMGYKQQQIPEKIGSTTRDILRFAGSSILSLKKELHLESIKNILLVTDFENNPIISMSNLKAIQDLNKAQLTILYVNNRTNWMSTTETYKRMDQFCSIHGLSDATLNIINDDSVEAGVMTKISRENFDLIGMKISKSDNKLMVGEKHVTTEVILDNTDIPLITYAQRNVYA